MADNGPGGREVGRVSLRVLPDTSRFLPSLKKYAERVERTVAVRLGAEVDARGLEADVQRITRSVEASAPTIRVPAAPVTDGFARDLQTQVRAASRAIEANIPLTADGERFRRQVMVDIARLETEIQRFDIEVPLDVEGAAKARAELKARVLELQALARMSPIDIPVSVGGGGGASSIGGLSMSPAVLSGLSGIAAVLAGSTIAALPAIVAAIAGPVAAIALGFEGIKTAATVARPAFDALRQILSNTFAKELAPVFATLGEVLPKLADPLERIAVALSGALGTLVDQVASPEGIAALQGILDGIASAIEILAPSIAPLTQVLLDMANVGMQAFVENAPALNDALTTMAGVFTALNDAGIIKAAADAFAGFVTAGVIMTGAIAAILVVIGAAEGALFDLRIKVAQAIGGVIGSFGSLVSGVAERVGKAIETVRTLPERVTSALSNLGSLLFGSGAALIQGLVDGILSKLGPVGDAVRRVAQEIKDHFPGSPVKQGPLTSWNGGGAGQRLGDLLASGLDSSRETVRSAANGLAGAVTTPALVGAGVSVGFDGALGAETAIRDTRLARLIGSELREAPLAVGVSEVDRSLSKRRRSQALDSPGRG